MYKLIELLSKRSIMVRSYDTYNVYSTYINILSDMNNSNELLRLHSELLNSKDYYDVCEFIDKSYFDFIVSDSNIFTCSDVYVYEQDFRSVEKLAFDYGSLGASILAYCVIYQMYTVDLGSMLDDFINTYNIKFSNMCCNMIDHVINTLDDKSNIILLNVLLDCIDYINNCYDRELEYFMSTYNSPIIDLYVCNYRHGDTILSMYLSIIHDIIRCSYIDNKFNYLYYQYTHGHSMSTSRINVIKHYSCMYIKHFYSVCNERTKTVLSFILCDGMVLSNNCTEFILHASNYSGSKCAVILFCYTYLLHRILPNEYKFVKIISIYEKYVKDNTFSINTLVFIMASMLASTIQLNTSSLCNYMDASIVNDVLYDIMSKY